MVPSASRPALAAERRVPHAAESVDRLERWSSELASPLLRVRGIPLVALLALAEPLDRRHPSLVPRFVSTRCQAPGHLVGEFGVDDELPNFVLVVMVTERIATAFFGAMSPGPASAAHRVYPHAEEHHLETASHFLQEDEPEQIVALIQSLPRKR